ncbi:metallophosphoesterase [Clostridium sp. CAG:921]|nr:metallophosphoesterase [Clostridium sp. CAG:921]
MPTIYAISDLHLSFGVNKPMNVFGKKWDNYEQRIKENWERRVKSDDYVLLPGDLSWGLTLKESRKDFEFINSLPGRKIILKGNHDYYFSTKSKLYNFFKENNFDTIDILHNNSYVIGDYVVCGTRGWGKTESGDATLDKKITAREEIRLRLSLEEGKSFVVL